MQKRGKKEEFQSSWLNRIFLKVDLDTEIMIEDYKYQLGVNLEDEKLTLQVKMTQDKKRKKSKGQTVN